MQNTTTTAILELTLQSNMSVVRIAQSYQGMFE